MFCKNRFVKVKNTLNREWDEPTVHITYPNSGSLSLFSLLFSSLLFSSLFSLSSFPSLNQKIGGNFHEITAKSDCAFFDILAPSYGPSNEITYYCISRFFSFFFLLSSFFFLLSFLFLILF